MDYSSLDPDIYMIQWTDGKGEIEKQIDINTNDNGLRDGFFDVTPYAPFFQQFLRKCPLLTLEQAKKIQIDLIKQLYDLKRQLPYHHIIAAGDYWWDASDGTMYSSLIPTTQNIASSLNQTISYVNAILDHLNSVISLINSGVSYPGNYLASEINNNVVAAHNNAIFADNVNNVPAGDALVAFINSMIDAINPGLIRTTVATMPGDPGTPVNAAPGVTSGLIGTGIDFIVNPYNASAVGSVPFANFSSLPLAHLPAVSGANTQWIPIGSSTPVNVTPSEQAAILQGIAARTNQLNLIKNQKTTEVSALTDIDDVIDYDVTDDWPDIPLPPGFDPNKMFSGHGGTMNYVSAGGGTGGDGVPEAPSDGVTYGRRNAVWNPALALSGDVLDGGNF
jgi:hypothetical protein